MSGDREEQVPSVRGQKDRDSGYEGGGLASLKEIEEGLAVDSRGSN